MIGAGPDFREEEFNWREGGVSVSGVARGNVLSIDMFSSTNKGKGEAETALRKLRKRFREIHALGVGSSDSDPSWRFWRRMREKGLIEAMTDDMGTEVNPPP